ncbi:hypothetical protein ACPV51_28020, partial [Vibrio astriarenae]
MWSAQPIVCVFFPLKYVIELIKQDSCRGSHQSPFARVVLFQSFFDAVIASFQPARMNHYLQRLVLTIHVQLIIELNK